MCSTNTALSPSHVVLGGPVSSLEALTRSSFREERQRAKTASAGGEGGKVGDRAEVRDWLLQTKRCLCFRAQKFKSIM